MSAVYPSVVALRAGELQSLVVLQSTRDRVVKTSSFASSMNT